MPRDENVAIVETFLRCIVSKDLVRLPVDRDLTVQSPLIPRLSGQAAMDYLKGVAAGVKTIEIKQHIVEGEWVATLFDEDTIHGRLAVFSRFHIVAGRIKDAVVFYDPRAVAAARR